MLELVASHPSTDAVLLLGLGIQSNQAALMRSGGFYPDHGLERIVDYHERQDERYGRAAAEVSTITGKPVICANKALGELKLATGKRNEYAALQASWAE